MTDSVSDSAEASAVADAPVVILGAVALGPKTACRYKRLVPSGRVLMVDRSQYISYGGCGIPYYVSGDVSDIAGLQSTTFHMVRTPEFFHEVKGVDVLPSTEAMTINRAAHTVRLRDVASGREWDQPYTKLVIATGSSPRRLPIPGIDLPGVHCVANLGDAEAIRGAVSRGDVERAVIVGAGFIGLEMAEALADMWGVEVTVVEIADQILPGLVSPTLAHMAQRHMEEKGVHFRLGHSVKALHPSEDGGRVGMAVVGPWDETSGEEDEELDAQLAITAAGVRPNDQLAREAGLGVHERGGILVNDHLRTSDPDIYAGGDCVLQTHAVTGAQVFLPLGSMANRQGRVIANNLAGRDETFPPVCGSFVVKLFETSLAGTGLSLSGAKRAGLDAVSVLMIQLDRAHFYPTKELMTLEIIVERGSRRILGVQGMGGTSDAMVGRINCVAAILPGEPTLDRLSNMELAYSPPFGSAMDVLNSLGNVASNVLDGLNRGMGPDTFARLWDEDGKTFFLDCREVADAQTLLERHPDRWHNIPQGEIKDRLDEIPRDLPIVLVCNTGTRSYEAQITLDAAGYPDVTNVYGGLAGIRKMGIDI